MNFPSLDFTNWREHPSDNRYTIFFFKTKEESDFFENLLKLNNIWFEPNIDLDEPTYQYYFAVNKTTNKEVIKLNHLTIGEYRSPLIENSYLRYGLVIGMMLIMTLAIIGYLKSH
jgi:hypothetical protein